MAIEIIFWGIRHDQSLLHASLSSPPVMDTKAVFTALYSVCEENATFFSEGAQGVQGGAAQRLVDTMTLIQEHARSLEPVISGFAAVYHHFDFDPHIPANGYRSLVKVEWQGLCVCDNSLVKRD